MGLNRNLGQLTEVLTEFNGNVLLNPNNTVGGTNIYIGQTMASNDTWRIYGNTVALDQGEMVFELGDNAIPHASNGQRFRFYYDNIAGGTAKSPFILDYNNAIFDTNASFTGTVSVGSITASNSITASSPIDTGGTKAFISAQNINGAALTLVSDSVGRTLRLSSNTSPNVIGAIDATSVGLNIVTNTSSSIVFSANTIESMRIFPTRNVFIGPGPVDAGFRLQVNGNTRVNGALFTNTLLGASYGQTSTSGTTSIVDTGIDANAFTQSGMYFISFGGNPNNGGSNAYKANYVGYISVTTGFIGGSVRRLISYTQTAAFDSSGIGSLTLSVMFFNGVTESTTINEGSTNGWFIRLKINGYNPSWVGVDQYVYLTRLN